MDTTDGYIQYFPGNCDVIILAAHGGDRESSVIPIRSGNEPVGNGITSRKTVLFPDIYTIEIAEQIVQNWEQFSGKRPYLVVNKLHRKYMDANRPRDAGTGNDVIAGEIWDEFQSAITTAKNAIGDKGGLIVDVHGHCHEEAMIELGYRIDRQHLNTGDYDIRKSTLKNLIEQTGLDLITGPESLGSQLDLSGYPSVPSSSTPSPGEWKYYRGGFNVLTHGFGHFDAVQVEIPKYLRNEENSPDFSRSLVKAILGLLKRTENGSQQFCDFRP